MNYAKRLARVLNQTAQLEVCTGVDDYGRRTFNAPENIKARVEGSNKLVRNTTGDTVSSTTTVFSLVEIKPGDKVNGYTVINSMQMVDGAGNVIGWESML